MKTRLGYVLLVFLLCGAGAPFAQVDKSSGNTDSSCDTTHIEPVQRIQLFSLELTTKLDSRVDSGGFDFASDFDRRLVSEVLECLDTVVNLCNAWADDKKLSLVLAEVQRYEDPRRVHYQLLSEELSGIFEIIYVVSSDKGRAQGSAWFYSVTGSRKHPNLGGYGDLSKLLWKAMQCSDSE